MHDISNSHSNYSFMEKKKKKWLSPLRNSSGRVGVTYTTVYIKQKFYYTVFGNTKKKLGCVFWHGYIVMWCNVTMYDQSLNKKN
jgi:hypothetical protein